MPPQDSLGLSNIHVLVTGAASGIGKATVAQLLDCNAVVTASDRSLEALRAGLAAFLQNPRLHLVPADIRNEAAVAQLFVQSAKHPYYNNSNPPTVLIANAGICHEGAPVMLADMSLAQWRATYTNNVDGTFLVTREFVRTLMAYPPHVRLTFSNVAIVITGSETAVFGQAGHADYASGKAALQYGLVRSLKNELAASLHPRARVNAVAPGWTHTPMVGSYLDDPVNRYRHAQATVALRKVAEPEDVARAIVWLASEKWAGHVSGQCISVDGGMEGRLLYSLAECARL